MPEEADAVESSETVAAIEQAIAPATDPLVDVAIITELTSEVVQPATTKLASPEGQLAATIAVTIDNNQPKLKSQLQSEIETKSKPIITANVLGNSKSAGVDDLALDKKLPATNLRSDIFYALSKNKSAGSTLLDNSVTKDHQTLFNQLSDRAERTERTDRSDRGSLAFSSALSATSSLNTASVQASPTAQAALAIQPAIHSQAWNQVLSSRVVWLAREGIQEASLRLNPAGLGTVEVKLNMHNDQANVLFIAQSATTRDALEQALPRLRESFEENGMQLTDAEVADQQFEQEQTEQDSEDGAQNGNALSVQSASENEQQAVNNEQEIEMGLSIYA